MGDTQAASARVHEARGWAHIVKAHGGDDAAPMKTFNRNEESQ
jgi:hypothetical protein